MKISKLKLQSLSAADRISFFPHPWQVVYIPMSTPVQVHDNPARQRFELCEDGKLAFADYLIRAGTLVIPHVEADPALRGRGTAGRLMSGVLEIARSRSLKVRPICGYAAAYIHRNPEFHDLLE